ncbi:MAG: polysaccharide deacetylase family protein [Pedobacter sp.]|uniref:polysaccharide deacetylase family protein n=1 Tax=Pedobacter sp. TaxID=1411316 RepID=UPI00280A3AAC|nr:polysaccharide deacetylase family protein [Pedobacter sp.]MDQ8003883.1 polysaccharide deacetylase family protein [Pedobacter sp.]
MQLLVYSPQVTPRIKYIFNFIFREVLRCDFEFTSVANQFVTYNGPKFSYAEKPLGNELFFKANALLLKNNIAQQDLDITDFGNDRVPFAVENSTLPFDIFAASFYLLSRYEEYLPYTPDEHLRFPAEKSLQYELGLLKTPVIDQWAMILKNLLRNKLGNIHFGSRKFEFITTIDIDRAYHFKSSGIVKNTARFIRAIAKGDTERLTNIISTGLGKKKDPFDTYDYLHQLHEKYQLTAIFFFLLSLKGDRAHDVNIHPNDDLLQQLIVETSKVAKVGIHPSYASNSNVTKLKEEKALLDAVLGKTVDLSRQHYLKMQIPKTYLQLIKEGINHDYTMGYASQVGFRAGTCTPFFWYDLQLEKQSHLKVHPFAAMDSTLLKYLKLQPKQAIMLITELVENVKMVDGTFYSLWHNESLSETGNWKGWKEVYEKMLALAVA